MTEKEFYEVVSKVIVDCTRDKKLKRQTASNIVSILTLQFEKSKELNVGLTILELIECLSLTRSSIARRLAKLKHSGLLVKDRVNDPNSYRNRQFGEYRVDMDKLMEIINS